LPKIFWEFSIDDDAGDDAWSVWEDCSKGFSTVEDRRGSI